jgi:dipeptidyl aminopeptidase/acylaminoacyl peptidase
MLEALTRSVILDSLRNKMKSLHILVVILAAAIGTGLLAGHQHHVDASFPGTNGRIAFQNANQDGEVWLMTANGSNPAALTQGDGDAISPAWSRDGTEIVYHRRSNDPELRIATVDGLSDDAIPNTEDAKQPTWAPDSQRVAFEYDVSAPALSDIAVINRTGTGFVNLTNTANQDEYSPDWSPDGTKLAFIREINDAGDLWIMDPDGFNQVNLTNSLDDFETAPDWSPDGSSIVFDHTLDEGTTQTIAVIDVQSKQLTNLTAGPIEYDPAYSPDGQHIVFYRYGPASISAAPQALFARLVVTDANGQNEDVISDGPTPVHYYPDWGVDIPGPPPLRWGDNNCSGARNPVDALATLVDESGIEGAGCPNIGATIETDNFGNLLWGDLDCSHVFDPPDVLLLLRDAAGLPPENLQDCPALGIEIALAQD